MSLRRLARNWNEFAARDPLWSILTLDDKRGNRWNLDEFLGTGRSEINAALRWARECRPQFGAGRALDFGCGVGRLTQALAASFAEVHGVDISENMIEAARRLDPEERATYHVNGSADLALFPDEHFDFVYSSITLQHMEPWLMRGYLREFVRSWMRAGAGCCASTRALWVAWTGGLHVLCRRLIRYPRRRWHSASFWRASPNAGSASRQPSNACAAPRQSEILILARPSSYKASAPPPWVAA